MGTIDVHGTPLHVTGQGSGEPVLVCGHGLYCTLDMFDPVAGALAATHRVVRFDARGHGDSGPPPTPYTWEHQQAEWLAVLASAGVERAVLVGFSMGGMAAMRLALAHPGRVAGLVLMNTSANSQSPAERHWMRLVAAVAERVGVHEAASELAVRLMFSKSFIQRCPNTAERWKAGMMKMHRQALAAAARLVGEREDILDRIGAIEVPCLVIGSEWDRATPWSHAEQLAGRLPDARLVRIERAGHGTPLEAPEQVVEHIRSFTESTGP